MDTPEVVGVEILNGTPDEPNEMHGVDVMGLVEFMRHVRDGVAHLDMVCSVCGCDLDFLDKLASLDAVVPVCDEHVAAVDA